jgi:tRNA pseudouridine38-40 synthase
MRTLRLLLEYDGSDFAGWQIQDNGRTVQGELERALGILLKESIRPIGSGRTDAGTHALGQVAHFQTASELPTERLLRGLNGLLPVDIAVREIGEVPSDFHARYSAKNKRYRYRIHMGKSAINRSRVWTYHSGLSLAPMVSAARLLLGDHSFGAFCKQDPVPESLHCQIVDCTWSRQGAELVFEIEANRFLRHMVRILVGTMVEIGRGVQPQSHMADLLASGDRSTAGPTAPARGLCLLWVRYDE